MKKNRFKFSKLHMLASLLVVFITGVFFAMFGFQKAKDIEGSNTSYSYESIGLTDDAFDLVSNSFSKYPDIPQDGSYLVFNGKITIPQTHTGSYDAWELIIPSLYKYDGTTYKVKEIRTGEIDSGATYKYDALFINGTSTSVTASKVSYFSKKEIEVYKIKKLTVGDEIEYIQKGSFYGFTGLETISVPFVGTSRLSGYVDNVVAGNTVTKEDPNGAFLSIFGDQEYMPYNSDPGSVDENKYDYGSYDYYSNDAVNEAPYYKAPYYIQNNILKVGNGLLPWHESDTNDASKYFVVPPKLENIYVTNAAYIAGEAFFHNPLYKHIEIEFGQASDMITQLDGEGNVIDNAKEAIPFADVTNYMSVGNYAFANCTGLVSAKLPEMASYGDGIFSQCKSLTDVDLPDKLTSINNSTFFQCISLTEITLPSNVSVIGDHAFDLCSNLMTLHGKSKAKVEKTFLIPDKVTEIGVCAFRYTSPDVINVPTTCEKIKYMAFNGCSNVKEMVLPFIGSEKGNKNTEEALFGYIFGDYGAGENISDFIDDFSLTVIQSADGDEASATLKGNYYIPKSLRTVTITAETHVGLGSFWNCSMITSLTIQTDSTPNVQDTTSEIMEGALYGCSNLTSLSIPFTGHKDSESGHLGYIFGTKEFTNSVKVQDTDWYIPSTLKTVSLSHATIVRTHSFYYVKTVEKFVIGASTQYMERAIFTGNTGMKELSVPFVGYHRGIYRDSYYWVWDRWHKETIRNSMLWLFEYATADEMYPNFYITSINWYPGDFAGYIPEKLTTINVTNDTVVPFAAFWGFSSVTDINILDNDKILTQIDGTCMKGCSSLKNINVPFIGRDENPYSKNDENYVLGYFFGEEMFPNTYTAYEAQKTYFIPKSLERIYFGTSMTRIANDMFRGCSSLTSVQSDANIMSLGDYAFANCTSLSTLTLKNATYSIVGEGAFMNDKALGEMTSFIKQLTDDKDNLIKKINDYAFYGTAVTDLHLKQFNYLGNYAFAKCLEISTVDFTGTSFIFVGDHLFDGCSHLENIQLTTYSSEYMFANCTALQNIYLNYLTQNNGGFIPAGFLYNCYNLKDAPSVSTTINNTGLELNPLTSGVVEIGDFAFAGCKGITKLTLPETLTKIGKGAFQNCTGLEMLRIPRDTLEMNAGSRVEDSGDITDLLDEGIFYGCNDNFYLQVFHSEDKWPTTWGYNWNCYYPVYIIGDSTENWFTYEYMPEYKGYFITGLNLYNANTNTDGLQFEEFFDDYDSQTDEYLKPVLNGSLTLPNTHDGLFVFGVKENAFTGNDAASILRDVEDYVLSPNCRYLGKDAFALSDYYTGYGTSKLINIFSNKKSEQAQNIAELHYGNESHFVHRGTIIYKEAWTYISTRPTIYMSEVKAIFESETFTYKLGKAIEPKVMSLTKNSKSIRYAETDEAVESNLDDLVKNAFHNIENGGYGDINDTSVEISYTDNINVGTGYVIIKSNDSRFTGTLKVPFEIIPYQVDLFNESDVYEALYANKYKYYYKYVADIVSEDAVDIGTPKAITHMQYKDDYWTWDNWTQGGYAYGLPNGYTMTGTLRTTDKHAGYYAMYKFTDDETGEFYNTTMEDMLYDAKANPLSCGGFEWKTSPRIYDPNGKEVTSNFSFMITKAVCIDQFEITSDNLTWDGSFNAQTGNYEYRYKGETIVPVPTVRNEDGKKLDLKAVVSVTPYDALYPGSVLYTATIDSFDNVNFKFGSNVSKSMNFIVKNAEVVLQMNAVYTIKETDNYFEFNDWANISQYPEYNISISGLNPTSSLTGNVKTSGWEEGVYRNTNVGSFVFDWDLGGYKITSSSLFETDGTPIDETGFYDLTLDINVTIKLIKFDYELCLDVADVGNYKDAVLSKTVGVNSVNYALDGTTCEIEYGADGYPHVLEAWIKNTTGASIEFEKDSNVASSFAFTNIGQYVVNLTIQKAKFYDVKCQVTINVVKGNYDFDNLTKEYDRLAIDPIAKLLRKPIDFKEDYLIFEYYNATTGAKLGAAPAAIGNYKVIINTKPGHSVWFNDLNDLTINFQITKRSLIIKTVDTIPPVDSKVYDGDPWKKQYTLATDSDLNLLEGDMLTGLFLSKRANIGVYSSEVYGDFIASNWKIDNDDLGEQTGYYKVVFEGDYEILPRTIKYTKTGVDKVYDGIYAWIDVNVQEPTSGYSIYYSEIAITTEEMDTDESEWVKDYPYTYNQPGTYTVYFKIVADTYKTVYDYAVINIEGKDVQFTLGDQYVYYDGFSHTLEVSGLDPWNAIILYASIDQDFDNNYENLSWSTTPNYYTEIGTYGYAIQVTAPNYNTKYGVANLIIQDGGPQISISVTGDEVDYDGKAYGFNINNIGKGLSINDLVITYAEESNPTDTTTWLTPSIIDNGDGTYKVTPYMDAGDYPLTLLIKAKGYAPSNLAADCKIRPISLGDIKVQGFSGEFDGKYHTLYIYNTEGTLTSTGIDSTNNAIADDQSVNYYLNTTVGGTAAVLNLTVYYSPVNTFGNADATTWQTDPVAYKDVGTYMIYLMVTGPNVETKYLYEQIIITRSPNPPTVDIEDQEIEYLARPILDTEVKYTTIHDGIPTFEYQAYDQNGNLNPLYITNPQAIGKYRVTIKFSETKNCLPTSTACDLTIIPRRLWLEYEDELEYDGTDQAPNVTVVSNTTDVFTCTISYTGEHIVVGDYTADVAIDQPMNGNYYLDPSDDVISYKIINRKVYVTLETEFPYDGVNYYTKYFDSTNLNPDDGIKIENLLFEDKLGIQITTNRKNYGEYKLTGTLFDNGNGYFGDISQLANGYYGYKIKSTSGPAAYPGMQDGFILQHSDGAGNYTDCNYYDIIFDLKVKFVYPELEITMNSPQEYTYDGTEKFLKYTVDSATGQGVVPNVTTKFWLLSNPDVKYTSLGYIDVGEYEIGYEISAPNFEPAKGEATLVIKQATVEVTVDPATKVYDKQTLDATYSVVLTNPTDPDNNQITIRESEKPEIWYFDKARLEELGFTINDIGTFFLNKRQPTHAMYDAYMNDAKLSYKKITQVGEYYAIVYFPGTKNIALTLGYETLSITKRPLYFNYMGQSPLIIKKDYDGYKQIVQMNSLEYDKTTGANSAQDAGLLPGFNFGTLTFKDCAFQTSSADARGEPGNGDPYQFDGDFEFFLDPYVSIKITSDGTDNECLNYYPVVNPVNLDGVDEYQVQVIICRIDLPKFDVPEYATVEYSGKDALPPKEMIDTPSDGEWKYYYRKCSDNTFSDPSSTATFNEQDIGYYELYLTILTGTNYYYWNRSGKMPYDETDNTYYYKKIKLTVIPKKVEIQWNEKEFVYDGQDHTPTGYILDVNGLKRYVDVEVHDSDDNVIQSKKVKDAGTYVLYGSLSYATTLLQNVDINYQITNPVTQLNILKRTFTVEYSATEKYLYAYWSKDFDETWFADAEDPTWIDGHTLDLTVTSKANVAAHFRYASQFNKEYTVKDENNVDVSKNYEFLLNLNVTLKETALKVQAKYLETQYTNQYITPDITFNYELADINMQFSTTKLDWNTGEEPSTFAPNYVAANELPTFKDVGWYRIYYKFSLAGSTDSQNTYSGFVDLKITQAQAYLTIPDLDKTYDGAAVNLPITELAGGYNGTASDLVIKYYNRGDTSNPLLSAPNDAGLYTVIVTNSADNQDTLLGKSNYSTLEVSKDFEISRREITLVVNDTWIINEESDLLKTWSHNGDLLNNNSATDYYVENIVTSTGLRYTITGNQKLQRKNYIRSTSNPYEGNFTLNEFDITWEAWYLNNGSTALDTSVEKNNMTTNYKLSAVVNLTVRFKYIEYTITDKTYDYNGQPKSVLPNITVTAPQSGYTLALGTVKGTYDLTDYNVTKPGVYTVYVKITCPNYEDAIDKTTITINYYDRLSVGLDVTDISKVYDALIYDGTVSSGGVPTITWTDPTQVYSNEAIPQPSSWEINYYLATGSTAEGWEKASQAMDEVVNANEYIIEIIIPAGVYYGETRLERHFKISRRVIEISGQAADYTYNGSTWKYDVVTNIDNLTISKLVNDQTNGIVHEFKSGTLYTTSYNAGEYGPESTTGKNIDIYAGYDISDQDGLEVTVNYEYIILVTLTIRKADMVYVWNIPDLVGATYPYGYTYDTETHYPSLTILSPSAEELEASGFEVNYSKDNVTFSPNKQGFITVNDYTIFAQLNSIPNYNNLQISQDFSIIMARNTLQIADLSKIYDGNTVGLPKITTLLGAEIAKAEWVTWLDENGAVIPMPKEVGKYSVRVQYPSTENYEGIEVEKDFEITKNNFIVTLDTSKLIYDTTQQTPQTTFTSDAYSALNVNAMLEEGLDYGVSYYEENDVNLQNPITKPSNVGTYLVAYKLISAYALKNFTIGNSDVLKNFYYIVPRDITISYSGKKPYGGSTPVTLTLSDLTVTNLPTDVTLTTTISTIPSKWLSTDTHKAESLYTNTSFTDYYKWDSNDGEPHLHLTKTNTDDDLNNYNIKMNINLTVSTDDIYYTVVPYDGVYDGQAHTFEFKLDMGTGVSYTLYYSTDNGATWDETLPYYTDATISEKHILVKAVFTDNTFPTTIFGDDETDKDSFYVKIAKAESILDIADEEKDMDKVYDGKLIENPVVTYNTFIEADKRDENLQFKYYQKEVTSSGGVTYTEINVIDVMNVGEYKVEVKLLESDNFLESETTTISFKITKRDVIVRFPDIQEKTYDADRWTALITNSGAPDASGAVIEGVSGVVESGLVAGDTFTGTIQTITANAGDYKVYPADFAWLEEPRIYNALNNNVTANYNIDVSLWAKINKASFEGLFEAFDYVGYVDGLYHGIVINWIGTPLMSGLANPMSLITYTTNPNDITSYTSTPITEINAGTTTVYFKIEGPNYETYDSSRKIVLNAKPTGAPTVDPKGKIDGSNGDRVYDGNAYNYDENNPDIILTNSDPADTRVPTITYYKNDGTVLTSAPIDAGNYYFTVSYNADANHAAAIFGENKEYSFMIKPYEIEVEWTGDKDATGSDPMVMYYTGQQLTPVAKATDTRTGVPAAGTVLASNDSLPTLTITVTNPTTGQAVSVGSYTAVASITVDQNQYSNNYRLKNTSISYKIVQGGVGPIPTPGPGIWPPDDPSDWPPDDPGVWPPDPWPTPDDVCEKIEIDDMNYKDLQNTPFTFGANELYVHVTFTYKNFGPLKLWYVFDQTTGETTKIYREDFSDTIKTPINQLFTIKPPKDDNGDPDWSLKLFDSSQSSDPNDVDYYYVPVDVVLTDKINTTWDTSTGDVSDLSKKIIFERLKLDPADGDVWVVDPGYETTYMWDTTATTQNPVTKKYNGYDQEQSEYSYTMDGDKLTFTIRVKMNGTLIGSNVDIELVEGKDYEIIWFNNTGPTEDGRFTVKSLKTASYEFIIGDEDATTLTNKAGEFVINSPEPKFLKLKESATVAYLYIDQNFTDNTYSETALTVGQYENVVEGVDTSMAHSDIVIGHTYQNTSVYYLLNQFSNNKQRIKIKNPDTKDFENNPYAYDPTNVNINLSTLTPDDLITGDETDYIKTGMIIELYDSDNPSSTDTPIDSIALILKGDTTCDGKIMAKDGTGILLNAVDVISEDDMKKPDYRAGLITQTVPIQMAKEASKINLHAVGNLDINEDYSLS